MSLLMSMLMPASNYCGDTDVETHFYESWIFKSLYRSRYFYNPVWFVWWTEKLRSNLCDILSILWDPHSRNAHLVGVCCLSPCGSVLVKGVVCWLQLSEQFSLSLGSPHWAVSTHHYRLAVVFFQHFLELHRHRWVSKYGSELQEFVHRISLLHLSWTVTPLHSFTIPCTATQTRQCRKSNISSF